MFMLEVTHDMNASELGLVTEGKPGTWTSVPGLPRLTLCPLSHCAVVVVWRQIILFNFLHFFLGCPEAIDLLGQLCRNWTVRKAVEKRWGNWSGRGSNLVPLAQRSKQVVFSPLLLSVLRLGSCQWNRVVAGATVVFDCFLMVPVRPPISM